MKSKQYLLPLMIFLGWANLFSQVDTVSSLFQELTVMDSLIFDRGFNHCEMDNFKLFIYEDFEFYHDKGGLTENKGEFIEGFEKNMCDSEAKPTRRLVKGSLEVFPMYNQGELYAALQYGEHEFYITEPHKEPYKTSTARFMHLWVKVGEAWQLKRVMSYDHQ